jgi:hypothetical protein
MILVLPHLYPSSFLNFTGILEINYIFTIYTFVRGHDGGSLFHTILIARTAIVDHGINIGSFSFSSSFRIVFLEVRIDPIELEFKFFPSPNANARLSNHSFTIARREEPTTESQDNDGTATPSSLPIQVFLSPHSQCTVFGSPKRKKW